MFDIDELMKVKPRKVRAPNIWEGDLKWSDVFDQVAVEFEKFRAPYGLCCEVRRITGSIDYQGERMQDYIESIMGMPSSYVSNWVLKKNKGERVLSKSELFEYRAAWARHLASQFRSKGL